MHKKEEKDKGTKKTAKGQKAKGQKDAGKLSQLLRLCVASSSSFAGACFFFLRMDTQLKCSCHYFSCVHLPDRSLSEHGQSLW